jgi:Rieske Fe-S protein
MVDPDPAHGGPEPPQGRPCHGRNPLLRCPQGGSSSASTGAHRQRSLTEAESSGGITPLAATTEIPVGGGKVAVAETVMVIALARQFTAFSAICGHMGCLAGKVADGTTDYPCHGSWFSVENASVVASLAPGPLPTA